MAERVYFDVKEFPDVKIIGKELRYNMAVHMQGENRIPAFWGQCFSDGTFAQLELQKDDILDDSYVGVMLDWNKGDGDFSYICGMLMKNDSNVPEGFVFRDLSAAKVAISWIKGKDTADVASAAHMLTEQKLKEEGYTNNNMTWCMELYNCPRFTAPDENGDVILDYYIPCD